MAAAGYVYTNAILKMQNGAINLLSDSLKYMLLTSSYSYNLDTDTNYAGISANEVTGTGYTAGGVAVTSPALTQIAANSWSAWAASTAYSVGQVVRPSTTNNLFYACVGAGTSGSAAPTWGTTIGETTTDNTATWLCLGSAGTKFTIASPTWTSATITARYGVLYDVTASNYLIALDDFGSNFASTNGTFQVTPDANSGLFVASRI